MGQVELIEWLSDVQLEMSQNYLKVVSLRSDKDVRFSAETIYNFNDNIYKLCVFGQVLSLLLEMHLFM